MLEYRVMQHKSVSIWLMSHPFTHNYVPTYSYVRRWAFRYRRKVSLVSHTSGESVNTERGSLSNSTAIC